jgi:predicted GIY-YIG superfamily endonuclease
MLNEVKDLARSAARPGREVLYIGATNDLERRVFEHQQGLLEGFTKKYRVTRLIYVEQFDRPAEMVARERQLNGPGAGSLR